MGAARENIKIVCPGGTRFFDIEPGARGTARVRCRNSRCRMVKDEVVVHYFDLTTGICTTTKRYLNRRDSELTEVTR